MSERELAQVIAGWEVGGHTAPATRPSFEELAWRREAWMDVCAAVACWPDLSPTVERRFVISGPHQPLEFLLATTHGVDGVAARSSLADLVGLLQPVLEPQCARSLKTDELSTLLAMAADMRDVAEVRCLSDEIPEGPRSFGTSLIRLLRTAALATVSGDTIIVSFMLSTAGPVPEDDQDLPYPFLSRKFFRPLRHERTGPRAVRFRLRLAASAGLPASVMAIAGTMALPPDELGGEGWVRACAPLARETAQAQLRTLGVVPWDGPEDDNGASTAGTATMFSLPTRAPLHTGCLHAEDVEHDLREPAGPGQQIGVGG